jgi:hypothetical protein
MADETFQRYVTFRFRLLVWRLLLAKACVRST